MRVSSYPPWKRILRSSLIIAAVSIQPSLANSSASASSSNQNGDASPLPYPMTAKFVGKDFMDNFDFYDLPDPTNSYVQYLNKADAIASNLTFATDDYFIARSDHKQTVAGNSPGRQSVRLVSQGQWGDGAYIFDIDHLPTGCGTWPALWTVTLDDWPTGGEIDVIEGANSELKNLNTSTAQYFDTNVAVLHTQDGCEISNTNSSQSGVSLSPQCSAHINGNEGCGIRNLDGAGQRSIGARFNQNGGGWYAMWRDIKATGTVSIYFWERNDTNVPAEVQNITATGASPETWGKPFANFSVPTCTTTNFFNQHVLVLNIAFCSQFTSSTYDYLQCPGDCRTYVAGNPTAFQDTYFGINSARIFADPSENGAFATKNMAMGLFWTVSALIMLMI